MLVNFKTLIGGSVLAAVMVIPVISHAAEVDGRLNSQVVRINQAARLGQIGPGEAAHLRGEAYRIRREIHVMRMHHGGSLTPYQRARINGQENTLDRQIFRFRHRY
jgi:hypothetical protein